MANIYSLKSGLASDTTVWSSGTVPVSGDRVLISAGHTVELDGVYEWGDDLGTTIVINSVSTTRSVWVNGTLKFSRTVSSMLTLNGGMTVNGNLDVGYEADAIPDGINATIRLNKSAVLANGKYTAEVAVLGRAGLWGASKTRWALLASPVAAGASSITVADATGWKAGDRLVLPNTSGASHDQEELRVIDPSYTTGNTIPLTVVTTYSHLSGFPIGNMSNNVNVYSYDPLYRGAFQFTTDHTTATEFVTDLGYCSFLNTFEAYSSYGTAFLQLANYSSSLTKQKLRKVFGVCFWTDQNYSQSTMQYGVSQTKTKPVFEQCIWAAPLRLGTSSMPLMHRGYADFKDSVSYGRFDNGSRDSDYIGGWIFVDRSDGSGIIITGASRTRFINTILHCCSTTATYYSATTGDQVNGMEFIGVDINVTSPAPSQLLVSMQSYGVALIISFDRCLINFAKLLPAIIGNQTNMTSAGRITLFNNNNDTASQIAFYRDGRLDRNNTEKKRSSSSLQFRPSTANTEFSYPITVNSQSGVPQTIVGYVKYDTAYYNSGTGFVGPTITVDDGANILDTFVAPSGQANEWLPITVNFTQTLGYDKLLTVRFKVQSGVTTGSVYFDGIPVFPFVTQCRHYGFDLTQESSPTRTVDPYVVATEAVAALYTGPSIDGTAKTISFSSAITAQEFYDYTRAWSCLNLDKDIPLGRAGTLYSLATGWKVIEPTLSGLTWGGETVQWNSQGVKSGSFSGNTFDFTAAGTYDFATSTFSGTTNLVNTSGGAVVVDVPAGTAYTNTGPNITVNVAVDQAEASIIGLTAGSRVQIVNVSTATEMFNDVIVGTSYTLGYPTGTGYSAGNIVRVRVAWVYGTTAKELREYFAIATSSGWSVLVSQIDDSVYNFNAIDGSTCTEFIADYPNVQIDINDLDGITTPQRGYAWYMYNQMTADGLRYYHGAITAEDKLNYRINVSIANMYMQNLNANPVKVTGARIYRSDDSTAAVAGGGGIIMDYGRTYGLNVGGTSLTSDERNKLLSLPDTTAIRSALAPELAHIDADISSRLPTVGYVEPDTAAEVVAALAATTIPVDVKKMNGATLIGTGIEADKWRGQ